VTPSLSTVLPIFNLERIVSRLVEQAVEVSSELTDRFEVLVIDNGSADSTSEIVHELGLRLPQVRLVRLPLRRRRAVVIDVALSRTLSDIVFLGDDKGALELSDLCKLWHAMDRHDIVVAYGGDPPAETLHERWAQLIAGQVPHAAEDTFQMIRRDSVSLLREMVDRGDYTIDQIEQVDLRWSELTIRRRVEPLWTGASRRHDAISTRSRERRPMFQSPVKTRELGAVPPLPALDGLAAVRDFALGE
jgi:glycosyltransferase involved in cell wall biosynthesis